MKKSILVLLVFICINNGYTQEIPVMGAQVFIEPGQSEEETDLWFRTLKENGMDICRIRMFESYMIQSDGSWDFSLFDRAFKMAEKYDVKVMGTFFPATEKTDIGGWKFPKDEKQLASFAEYIKQLTLHFKQFKSLYAWVLINEPGGGLKENEFSGKMRTQWAKLNPQEEYTDNGYPVLVDLQEERFKEYMTSWMLNWIAGQVRKYDKNIQLHVNNHAIFNNLAEYDFPYWRGFLNSLGGSAHAAWHFGMFTREQYALAMSANSEMLYSGAGNLPWLMTELQGGNNTYSALNPMCPTAEEITQWLWTIIGTAGKGAIFWSLNPRASGVESGEWALLDFQHQVTDRVQAINEVSSCISKNRELFKHVKKYDSRINLLYIRESLWTEKVLTENSPAATDGRKTVMRNLLGYFKALSELGVNANIKAFEEFDFTKNDYSGTTIILANQIAVPNRYANQLEKFVEKGGKLFIDGLTGYYDEDVHNRILTGSPLSTLLGGQVSEFRHLDGTFYYELKEGQRIPSKLWKGFIRPSEKTGILARYGNNVLATRNSFGNGEVVWIPGLLGMGAWDNTKPLANYLKEELKLETQPLLFKDYHRDILMKTLTTGDHFITIILNKSGVKTKVEMNVFSHKLKPEVLFSSFAATIENRTLFLEPEETLVLSWH